MNGSSRTEVSYDDYAARLKRKNADSVADSVATAKSVGGKKKLKNCHDSTGTKNVLIHGGDNPIHLDAVLTKSLRPHQIEGVQFLWKEVLSGQGIQAAGSQ